MKKPNQKPNQKPKSTPEKLPVPKGDPQNPTKTYAPRASNFGAAQAYWYDGKPWFSYYHIPRMRRDPFINWLLNIWQYPLQQVKFHIEASSPEVLAFVQESLQKFWTISLPVILKHYACYGYAPAGFEYCVRDGLWVLDDVTPIQPLDARPHRFNDTTKFAGFQLRDDKMVTGPYAFWFAAHEEMGLFYDRPPLAGAYDPWLECNGRGGAKDLRQLYARKHSVRPAVCYHRPGQGTFQDKDGNTVVMQRGDMAMAALEYAEAGSNVAIATDIDDKGHRDIEIEWAQPNADAPSITNYPDRLKKEMAAGLDIPLEVIEAAETGSGYSGRKIPYVIWLAKADQTSPLLVRSFDTPFRPIVRLNFGKNADYKITALSLVTEEKSEEKAPNSGNKDAGSSRTLGTAEPYNGPKGGTGYRNPATGEVRYAQDSLGHKYEMSSLSKSMAEAVETTSERVRQLLGVKSPAELITGDRIDEKWVEFSPDSGTKGVPRKDMPQILSSHRGALVNYLKARGVTHTQLEMPANELKPTQREFSPQKVAKAKSFSDTDRSILVSSDDYVLDGHHQWLAKLDAGKYVAVIKLAEKIEPLLKMVANFPSVQISEMSASAQSV